MALGWIAREGPVAIRHMQEDEKDLRLFLKWMTDPQTMRYWAGMSEHFTYERVVRRYREHIEEGAAQCILEYEGQPIGFCQFCLLDAPYYEVPQPLYDCFVGPWERAYGIDLFIGETDCRDRGIGSQCLRLLMAALFSEYGADVLLIDPKVHNARAIACYRKSGFADCFILPHRELQDGVYHDSLILQARRGERGGPLGAPQALLEKGFTFPVARERDFADYLQIKKECFSSYVVQYYGGWEEGAQRRRNREAFEIGKKQSCFQKVLLYGETVGFFSFDEREDTLEGITIQLSERARGQGIGSFFLREVAALSDRTGKPAILRVFRSNPAQALYRRFGFEAVGETASHCRMQYTPASARQTGAAAAT